MSILANCTQCGREYRLTDDYRGKKVRCKECGTVFPVDAGRGAEALTAAAPARGAARPEPVDGELLPSDRDRPARRRGGESSSTALVVGVIALVLVIFVGLPLASCLGVILYFIPTSQPAGAQPAPPDVAVAPAPAPAWPLPQPQPAPPAVQPQLLPPVAVNPPPAPQPGAGAPADPEPNPRFGGPDSLDRAVKWLRGNQLQQLRAIEWLAKQKADPAHRDEVAAALEECLNGDDRLVALRSTDALGVWATKKQVPSLLKALDDSNVFARQGAARALGPLQDPRAVAPVARCLKEFSMREAAGRSLIAMGPMAADEVRKYLKDDDPATRAEAARVLRQIGGTKPEQDDLTVALADLRTGNLSAQQKALKYLLSANPDNPRRAEVAAELARMLKEPSPFTRRDAARALAVWATKDQVPDLIDALGQMKFGDQAMSPVLEALGRLKDPRAVVPVAHLLTDHFHYQEAVKTLIAIGPPAEDEVLKYLNNDSFEAKEGACQVLKEVGTRKSLPALKQTAVQAQRQMYADWRNVAAAAQEAVAAIQKRKK